MFEPIFGAFSGKFFRLAALKAVYTDIFFNFTLEPFLPAAAGLDLAIFLVLIFFFFPEVENQAIRRPKQAI